MFTQENIMKFPDVGRGSTITFGQNTMEDNYLSSHHNTLSSSKEITFNSKLQEKATHIIATRKESKNSLGLHFTLTPPQPTQAKLPYKQRKSITSHFENQY